MTAWHEAVCASTLGRPPGSARHSPCSRRASTLARGTDVVVGFVEDHGRPLTRDPRRRSRGRSRARPSSTEARSSPRWTSTPSSTRHPAVALVDELAHTNVPGVAQRQAMAGRRGAARGWHRRHHRRSTSSTSSRSTTSSSPSRESGSARPCLTRWCDALTRSSWSTCPRRRCVAAWCTETSIRREDRRRTDELLPARQPHRLARAGAALGRRPGRRGPRPLPASSTASQAPWPGPGAHRRRPHGWARGRAL